MAIDSKGDFVVSWQATQPNGNTFILAQKFNPSGNAVGGVVQVAVGTFAQTQAHVAMDANGDFVVSYTRDTNNNNPDIFAKIYNVNEQLVNVVSVATTSFAETNSSVAETPDGRIYVAYQVASESGGNLDSQLKEFTPTGALLETRVIALNAENPSVSADNFGNAVVAWESGTIPTSTPASRQGVSNTRGPVARDQHRHPHRQCACLRRESDRWH